MKEKRKNVIKEILEIEQYWAPKVNPSSIQRLYLTDAKGIVDEELTNDVGYSLYARCRTIYIVTERRCPECETKMEHRHEGNRNVFVCPACDWRTTWGRYHRSYKGKRIHGGRAYPAFLKYMEAFRSARSSRDKMYAIDRLIHAVHEQLGKAIASPGSLNLIAGTPNEVVNFLDKLAYGDTGDASEARKEYVKRMAEREHLILLTARG